MTRIGIFVIVSLLVTSIPAYAQGAQTVRQSGNVTASHATCWTAPGVVQDCYTSATPFATTFGVYGTGTPFCVLNTQITLANINSQAYYKLCLGYATGSTAAQVSLAPLNGAPPIPFDFIINGVTYPFPQIFPPPPIAATPLRNIITGATDTVTSNDANGTVAWDSPTASTKTETIPQCVVSINGFTVSIKDEIGTASTYNITIISSSTIDNSASFVLRFNLQSATFQCDAVAENWVVK